jgi:hypothetical protein
MNDDGFAHVLLLVCAHGSSFVDDPRVLCGNSLLSGGWKYFNQVQLVRRSLLSLPTLHDIQTCCVSFINLSHLLRAHGVC